MTHNRSEGSQELVGARDRQGGLVIYCPLGISCLGRRHLRRERLGTLDDVIQPPFRFRRGLHRRCRLHNLYRRFAQGSPEDTQHCIADSSRRRESQCRRSSRLIVTDRASERPYVGNEHVPSMTDAPSHRTDLHWHLVHGSSCRLSFVGGCRALAVSGRSRGSVSSKPRSCWRVCLTSVQER